METAKQQTRLFRRPVVSVCIPAYNARATIVDTLASVWSQTYGDFEVIVVDDCSNDETPALLRAQSDTRLRVLRNHRNLGAARTANRALVEARGRLIKFLDADDALSRTCLEQMVELADCDRVGMVFCRRSLMLEDPDDDRAQTWSRRYRDVTLRFGRLRTLNRGRELFARWAAQGFNENWVGEPLVVMLRRDLLERTGGFNPHIRQRFDLDLWARAMPLCVVAFIAEELARYRVSATSLTTRNHRDALDWLDELWTLEGLMCIPQARAAAPGLDSMRRRERRRVRDQFRDLLRSDVASRSERLNDAQHLAAWLALKCVRPAATPYAAIGPPPLAPSRTAMPEIALVSAEQP